MAKNSHRTETCPEELKGKIMCRKGRRSATPFLQLGLGLGLRVGMRKLKRRPVVYKRISHPHMFEE
jgi:hypothetical protein